MKLLYTILFFVCTSLQVQAAFNWGTPVVISATPSSNPQVAVDPSGNAVAVWQTTSGGNFVTTASNKSSGFSSPWSSPPDAISAPGSTNIEQVIKVDASGNAIAAWRNGTTSTVQYATKLIAGTWSAAANVSAITISLQPSLAINATGNAFISWRTIALFNRTYAANKPTFGSAWSAPTQLSVDPENTNSPQIAVDASGDAIDIWVNSANTLRYATFTAGSWSLPANVSGDTISLVPGAPQIAVDSSGNAVAVWANSSNQVRVATRPFLTGIWSSPVTLSTNGSSQKVAVNLSGNTTIVWVDTASQTIQAATGTSTGSSWDTLAVSSALVGTATTPQVAINASGQSVVVWQNSSGGLNTIYGSGKTLAATSWDTPVNVSINSSATNPSVGIDDSGNPVAVWQRASVGTFIEASTGEIPPPPAVISIFPTSGPAGTSVTITGTGFTGTTAVNFGGTPATSFVVNSDMSITAIAPAGTGTVNVTVTTPDGTSPATPADLFTFTSTPPPTPSSNFTGKQVLHRFPAQGDLINPLSWPPFGVATAYYNVYRENVNTLIAQVTSTHYDDHQRVPNQVVTYLITAVDGSGVPTATISITVQPLKID